MNLDTFLVSMLVFICYMISAFYYCEDMEDGSDHSMRRFLLYFLSLPIMLCVLLFIGVSI